MFRMTPQKHREHVFLFLLENMATHVKGKQFVYFDFQNVNSLCSRYHYIITRFYQVICCVYTQAFTKVNID